MARQRDDNAAAAGPSTPRRLARLRGEPQAEEGPSGRYNLSDTDGEDSDNDDDVVVLPDAPAHMRPRRPMTPIVVPDDSGDDGSDNDAPVAGPSKRPRARSDSFEILSSPPPMKRAAALLNGRPRRATTPQEEGPPPAIRVDYLVPIVLEVVPDLCPDWARNALQVYVDELQGKTNVPGQEAVDRVINMAFEMDRYPRVGDKDAPPQEEKEEGDYRDTNYRNEHRKGPLYSTLALDMLETIFTAIPVQYIREVFGKEGNAMLVPTYLALHRHSTKAEKPYKELKRGRNVNGKGKERAERANDEGAANGAANEDRPHDFSKESAFLRKLMSDATDRELRALEERRAQEKSVAERTQRRQRAIDQGNSEECGCCFDDEATEDMVACPAGHLFCRSCVKSLAETKLGEQQTTISCMDMSNCDQVFTDAVLGSVLSATTMSLYHRLRQMKELEAAAIDGLESCPHCPFALVIENPDEKLFRCLNPECRKITCRKCKRPDHIPKRCEEIAEDYRLNNRHVVEEAMSAALMRRCPKCAKAYLKESGCNKITCQNCRTVSCYICQKEIPEDYAHFDRAPGGAAQKGRCQLWDRPEDGGNDAERIRRARDEATARVKAAAAAEGQQLEDNDIRVDAPEAPRAPPPAGGGGVEAFARRNRMANDYAALGEEARAMINQLQRDQADLVDRQVLNRMRQEAVQMQRHAQMMNAEYRRIAEEHQAARRVLPQAQLAQFQAPRNPLAPLANMYRQEPIPAPGGMVHLQLGPMADQLGPAVRDELNVMAEEARVAARQAFDVHQALHAANMGLNIHAPPVQQRPNLQPAAPRVPADAPPPYVAAQPAARNPAPRRRNRNRQPAPPAAPAPDEDDVRNLLLPHPVRQHQRVHFM